MYWVLWASVCGQMFLFHSRKAGGTSLRNALPFATVQEGYNLDRRKMAGEVWVTSIRDPVDRLWSSFKYEGRWQGTRFAGQANKEITFTEWQAQTNTTTCSRKTWQCSANCFTRWFSGCTSGKIEAAFDAAVSTLAQFDVVVNVHRMRDPNYNALVQACLNLTRPVANIEPWLGKRAKHANNQFPADHPPLRGLVAENSLDYALLQPYWYKPPCKR